MALKQGMSWYRRQAAPITIGIIASLIVFAFVWWFTGAKGMENIVLGPGWQQRPWTLFTYPWAEMPFTDGLSILFFVFLIMWMFWVGGSAEHDLGPTKYAVLWISMILLPALFIGLLGPMVGKVYGAAGTSLPVAAITMVWCVRNPAQTIMIWGIIPLSGRWLGWITVASTILLAGFGNPLMGVICALHLAVAAAFAANMIPFWTYSRGGSSFGKPKITDRPYLKKSERMDKGYYDDVKKREKEREERERLRKLFESSLDDDGEGNKGKRK
jgi:hypothetical protein